MATWNFGRIFKQLRELKIKVMGRIRIESRGKNLLAVIGTALILGATFFNGSPVIYFLGSVCFGLIFQDMIFNRK